MTLPWTLSLVAIAIAVLTENSVIGSTPGVGWLVLTLATLLAVEWLARRLERAGRWTRLLAIAPLTFSLAMTIYDSAVARRLGPWLTVLGLVLYITWRLPYARPSWEALGRLFPTPPHALVRESLEQSSIGLGEITNLPCTAASRLRRVLVGLLWSLPLLLVFGLLFCSADANFCATITSWTRLFSPESLISTGRIFLIAGLVLGLLRASLELTPQENPEPPSGRCDPLVLAVVLASLNLLFATFVGMQARYLFEGKATLAAGHLAQFARRGFFQLCICTLLVFVVLAVVHRLSYREPDPWPRRLSAGLVLLTYGVAAAAAGRMVAYVHCFGMTVLRFYASAGMATICLLLVLMLHASFRRLSLAWLSSRLVSAVLVVLSLTALVNVDGLVARVDVARPKPDVAYLASLSADAAPALAQLLHRPDERIRRSARQALKQMTDRSPSRHDWGGWNYSRSRLARAAGSYLAGAATCTGKAGTSPAQTER